MVIRNNASGQKATRYLGGTQSKLGKTLEKLSSGYRINRASDDAAGIAISEKMRLLMTGLGRAEENSLEGIRLVQTGEGALAEVHAMLDRAYALAGQSSNGTYQDLIDREGLQAELDQLCAEIDRIAEGANFNGIALFQDDGYEFETTAQVAAYNKMVEEYNASIGVPTPRPSASAQTAVQSLETSAISDNGKVNIVFVQHDVQTTQTPYPGDSKNPASANTLGKDLTISGSTRKLSDVLEKEIVPQAVNNILNSYSAFRYLTGSQIGIGLEYFEQGSSGGSTTMAYVRGGVASTVGGTGGFMTYTLGVNVQALRDASGNMDASKRSELESTIAHEMIHAFMDEATTFGMLGNDKFPSWFVEGMAQTASGPDNWIKSSGGLGLNASPTDTQINTAIAAHPLLSSENNPDTASNYGTGYLACMYLGAAIAGGGTPSGTVDARTILTGLNKLMNDVIGGKSLNNAISDLTNGAFTSLTDFQTKFNNGSVAGLGDFVRSLLVATGTGMGGLISGNLSASDLLADVSASNTLFALDIDQSVIQNTYPNDYPIYTGGSANSNGVAPTDFNPVLPSIEKGNFVITGASASDIEYDATTKTLTVKAGGDIRISMKSGTASTDEKIVLDGTGKVTLDGVNTSGAVEVNKDVEITYEGENEADKIELAAGVRTTLKGEGRLKINTFTSDTSNEVTLTGGAVVVGGGSGTFGTGTRVKIKNTAVSANLPTDPTSTAGTALQSIAIPWAGTGGTGTGPALNSGFGAIKSISIDGVTSQAVVDPSQLAYLWLDPKGHRVTFEDVNGKTETFEAVLDATGQFTWKSASMPFQVSGGTEGTDWEYGSDGRTLIIKSGAALTISGGSTVDASGNQLIGKIKVADGIGTANLTLDGVNCNVKAEKGCAFDLGTDNNVTLTLSSGKTNEFTSGEGYAGISVGARSHLTIQEDPTGNGKLSATGGYGSAGIGRSNKDPIQNDKTSSITIKSGTITAVGSENYSGSIKVGSAGAGIGASTYVSFGDITIEGGHITATGSMGGAGIGGAGDDRSETMPIGNVGDITIKGGTVIASSHGHGAGIGGGWGLWITKPHKKSECGKITISGGDITASSKTHGTGIGAGCMGTCEGVEISGGKINATGGDGSAGIGGSARGECTEIKITGGNITAKGGNNGAGIGSGEGSSEDTTAVGKITIDTTGTITATGGTNGVGIGSGRTNSACGDIEITQGTIVAKGSTDSTGIGAGRGSKSGNITIGNTDPTKKTVVTATGGMTNGGGNIMSYKDNNHTEGQEGTLKIVGGNTTVRPGTVGEGLYSTSGAVDEGGSKLYSYPLYLFSDGTPLDAGVNLESTDTVSPKNPPPFQPNKAKDITISVRGKDGSTKSWSTDLLHEVGGTGDRDGKYTFLWMTGQDQTLTVSYTDANGQPQHFDLELKFYEDSGTFRVQSQPRPPAAQKPGYNTGGTTDPDPDNPPVNPDPPEEKPDPMVPIEGGGIILQIGAEYGEILEVPQFYLSTRALGLGDINISTQKNALASMPVIKNAINRVSSIRGTYGAISNRLDHNRNALNLTIENLTDAESRIRDADMAAEYTDYLALTIRSQAAQAMVAQSNQNASRVMQFFQ